MRHASALAAEDELKHTVWPRRFRSRRTCRKLRRARVALSVLVGDDLRTLFSSALLWAALNHSDILVVRCLRIEPNWM